MNRTHIHTRSEAWTYLLAIPLASSVGMSGLVWLLGATPKEALNMGGVVALLSLFLALPLTLATLERAGDDKARG